MFACLKFLVPDEDVTEFCWCLRMFEFLIFEIVKNPKFRERNMEFLAKTIGKWNSENGNFTNIFNMYKMHIFL